MFIARAVCESDEFGTEHFVICTDDESETKPTNDCNTFNIKYTRPIVDSIMAIAATKNLPASFDCNGIKRSLVRYSINDEERYYNKYRTNHVSGKLSIRPLSEIYVYSQRCRCAKCYSEFGFDSIENYCGEIPLVNRKKIQIDLQKCKHCNSIFIDEQSLRIYERKYGPLNLRKHRITGNEYVKDPNNIMFNTDSILSRNGYSTKKSESERKAILVGMMESGIKKAEIKDKLSEFIYFRSERNPNASVIWQHDLEFVNSFELELQDTIVFR